MKIRYVFCVLILLVWCACYHEQEIPVIIDFQYSVSEGSYTVPAGLTLTNSTTGADFYSWTFEGASPATSDKKQPGKITYGQAGTYTIKLEAWNDTQRTSKEITLQLDSAVTLDFEAVILVNDFAPAVVQINNRTRGASSYEWTFEGGDPETSTLIDPGQVAFSTPGEHVISLKVSNGRETYTSSQTILLNDALNTQFEIIPSFADEDYEAPLVASLANKTLSGLTYTWTSTGGTIENPTSSDTDIYFSAPGEYTVTLTADNKKETKSVEHTIVVKPNTNLYTMNDVKLGVSAAHTTVGCFYSPTLRKVLTKDGTTEEKGSKIDLVFYGVNSSFSYCRFVSPDVADDFTFPAIPNAVHTYVVNTQETTALWLSTLAFDAMTNDTPLTGLDIKLNDTGTNFFSNSDVPRIILFETYDGRKGAVKIKSFVSEGVQSYIIADIKIQKLKS